MPGQEIVAVTGHRPDKLGGWRPCPEHDLVKTGLLASLTDLQPSILLSGMALGTDQWTVEIAINLGIPFVPFLPYATFGENWPPRAQLHLQWLLSQASQKPVIVCEGGYEKWKLDARNRWMVDNCQRIIAVYAGLPGGTRNCLEYAMSVGKPIEYVSFGINQHVVRPRQVTNFGPQRSQIIDQLLERQRQAPREPQREEFVVRPRVRRIIEE